MCISSQIIIHINWNQDCLLMVEPTPWPSKAYTTIGIPAMQKGGNLGSVNQ